MLKSGEALVLRRKKEGEKDAIVLLLFDTGERLWVRMFGILASIHRDRALAEPGSYIRITYYTKDSDGIVSGGNMKEGVVVDRNEFLKSDFQKMVILSYLLELVAGASQGESDAAYFRLLRGALTELKGSTGNPGAGITSVTGHEAPSPPGASQGEEQSRVRDLLNFFRIRILKISGNLGDASHCSRCGSPLQNRAFQERPEMSFLCSRCDVRADSDEAWLARSVHSAGHVRYASWRGTDDAPREAGAADVLPESALAPFSAGERGAAAFRSDDGDALSRLLEKRLEEALRHYISFSRVTVEELYRHYYREESP